MGKKLRPAVEISSRSICYSIDFGFLFFDLQGGRRVVYWQGGKRTLIKPNLHPPPPFISFSPPPNPLIQTINHPSFPHLTLPPYIYIIHTSFPSLIHTSKPSHLILPQRSTTLAL
ncbi:hypothetical protein L6452_00681 [Arctium lappa]|uniref:Uncharacterized protein n=1 Tax=Arctium lappa TaxID=4217 RepID=A0ACB9FG09_ARCLA|nr:hypothetical protein L6452_00681 [Arctium lappa]